MKVDFQFAPEIKAKIKQILVKINLPHIDPNRIIAFKSYGSKSRAYARIWSMPSIWQKALKIKPHYCIEVIARQYDRLNEQDQTRTLIHELLHIPKTFSGALLPHRRRGNQRVDRRSVEVFYREYLKNNQPKL